MNVHPIIEESRADETMRKIKYCCRNFRHGSKDVYKSLKSEYPEARQKKKDCLGCCKVCTKMCMAVVGKDEVVCAASPEALYEKLKQLIG